MPEMIRIVLISLRPFMIFMAIAAGGVALTMLRDHLIHYNRKPKVTEKVQKLIPIDDLYNE